MKALRLAGTPILCALVGGSLAFAPAAHAIYGPVAGGFGADLVSVDNAADEQGDAPSTDADISADGRYVVFQTKATNFFEDDGETQQEKAAEEPPGTLREGGIFRYDRETGQLQIVASGNLVVSEGKESRVLVRGAQNPSISADGRYVAFVTGQRLIPNPQPEKTENLEVYERDMDDSPGTPGADTLVSAQNGSEEAPHFEDASIKEVPGGDPGTQLWPNTAISADGRYVLFRTAELKSSLPEATTPETEPNQLFVRDVQARTTTLVTQTGTGTPAGGAEGPATLSADGSTVAWVGAHALQQTAFLPGEDAEEQVPYYLWRRWQEPHSPTRRITGIADPEDPQCEPGSSVELNPGREGPCYGPLSFQESHFAEINQQAPGLSADGYEVAFLAGSELRPDVTKPDALDLFLTSMAAGVTRKAATSELTLAVKQAQGDSSASITSLAFSADGTHIAFVSQRNVFALPEPPLLGSVSATAKQDELYVVDRLTDTMERAVVGVESSEPNGSTLNNPTLTQDGSTVAFVSQASNLIAGDANGVSDAFTADLQAPAGIAPAPPGVNAPQEGFSLSTGASPELGLQVRRGKGGGLILLVETPGAGKLTAQARGTIAKKVGKRTKRTSVVMAHASATARAEGTTTLVLDLSSKYTKALSGSGKLKSTIAVDFTPPTPAEPLSAEASATFLSKASRGAGKTGKGAAKVGKGEPKQGRRGQSREGAAKGASKDRSKR
jgi:Tol biopolymer transport system component